MSDRVIFVHIPKTAGSTLNRILRRQYGRRNIYSIDGGNNVASVEAFKDLSLVQRNKYRLIQGHWQFGLHELLSEKVAYITVMREPVDRLVSAYYYILRDPAHYLYDKVAGDRMTLDDYITSELTVELDNGQLRMLAGCTKSVPFGGITEEQLAIAKRNIEQNFRVVGLTHRFDETLLLFKHALGWKKYPYYHLRNVTARRPHIDKASPQSLALVRERNRYECELYDWVAQRFDQQIKAFGHQFLDELDRFKLNNKRFQRWTLDVKKPAFLR